MNPGDPIVFRELPLIQKIIQDETWLEGERRGCEVSSSDRIVRERVCEIILRIGQQLRDSVSKPPSGPVLGLPGAFVPLPRGSGSSEAA